MLNTLDKNVLVKLSYLLNIKMILYGVKKLHSLSTIGLSTCIDTRLPAFQFINLTMSDGKEIKIISKMKQQSILPNNNLQHNIKNIKSQFYFAQNSVSHKYSI